MPEAKAGGVCLLLSRVVNGTMKSSKSRSHPDLGRRAPYWLKGAWGRAILCSLLLSIVSIVDLRAAQPLALSPVVQEEETPPAPPVKRASGDDKPATAPKKKADNKPKPNAADLSSVKRVIAVGDIHGDYDSFVRLLKSTGLVDDKLAWKGKRDVLVQTGDIVDRGDTSRKAVELLMRLEKEAEKAGGRVEILLGNHEVLNMIGDLRYVTAGEFASYAVDESPELRREAIRSLSEFFERPKPRLRSKYMDYVREDLSFLGFDRYFEPGYFRHRQIFSPKGRYGKWLLSKRAIFKVDRTLFLHAGLDLGFGRTPFRALRERCRKNLLEYFAIVDELTKLGVYHPALGEKHLRGLINAEFKTRRVHPELEPIFRRYVRVMGEALFSEDGVTWYRGMAQGNERSLQSSVDRVAEIQDVDQFVIGHTQARDLRVRSRFRGRVIMIDTGMNHAVYHGHAEASRFSTAANDAGDHRGALSESGWGTFILCARRQLTPIDARC